MKAITILQPWASLIACGAKQIETRCWKTNYRGPIAIHAGKSCKPFHMNIAFQEPFYSALKYQPGHMLDQGPDGSNKRIRYPQPGSVIAIAELTDCVKVITKTTEIRTGKIIEAKLEDGQIITGDECEFGDYEPGRYAWILNNVQQIEPVPVKGQQRIWEWDKQQAYSLQEGG